MTLRTSPQHQRVFKVLNNWKSCALESEDSLFSPGKPIWSLSNVQELYDHFVMQPDESSDRSFFDKFEIQLSGCTEPTKQLAAELYTIYVLVAWQTLKKTKLENVNQILSWMTDPPEIPDYIQLAFSRGLINPGQAFNSYRYYYLEQLVRFMLDWKEASVDEQRSMLNDPWKFKDLVNRHDVKGAVGQRNILLHYVHPESFEDISSQEHKKELVEVYADYITTKSDDIDQQLLSIRENLEQEMGYQFHWYHPPLRGQWLDDSRNITCWVEKTKVKGRPDRNEGEYQVGNMLWSPQEDTSGKKIYNNMTKVAIGDIIFHLTDNEAITGVSRVQNLYDDNFTCLSGTEWENKPGYQVSLIGYRQLEPPLQRSDFLENEKYKTRLIQILNENKGLFYNVRFELNQGAYLTKAPRELVKLLNECYSENHVVELPYVDDYLIEEQVIGENTWCIYVPKSAGANYQIGKQAGVWGWKGKTLDIKTNDRVIIVFGIRSDKKPIPKGYPRVSSVDDFRGIADEVLVVKALSNAYESEKEIWPDDLYPHRFKFKIYHSFQNQAFNNPRFAISILDATRHSACNQGLPQYAGSIHSLSINKEMDFYGSEEESTVVEHYGIDDALEDLFLEREDLETILSLWKSKKNLIIQGAPGTGKSYMAKQIAYCLLGEKVKSRIEMVQFHQSYTYEDFIQGIRPKDGEFILQEGLFYEFVKKAIEEPNKKFVFIIDEINRGNLSKIFGELMLLIEGDKRGEEWEISLTYSDNDEKFHIPPNLFLLGLMNTADRSLAMVDYALRRRFAFYDAKPMLNSGKFKNYLSEKGVDDEIIQTISQNLSELNQTIIDDSVNLGPGFCIGHSFFCNDDPDKEYDFKWYQRIILSEIAPLLREYWFDDQEAAEREIDKLLN